MPLAPRATKMSGEEGKTPQLADGDALVLVPGSLEEEPPPLDVVPTPATLQGGWFWWPLELDPL